MTFDALQKEKKKTFEKIVGKGNNTGCYNVFYPMKDKSKAE